MMLKIVGVLSALVISAFAQHAAVVKLESSQGVQGVVKFSTCEAGLMVEGWIEGLTPGKHGFHVHQFGDLRKGCDSTGGHFNPFNETHGAPDAPHRHVGDLGNIIADDIGVANFTMTDGLISFKGETNIIGRAIVIHSGEDDLGLGNQSDSLTTGHAGSRVACGIIGVLTEGNFATQMSPIHLTILLCSLVTIITSII